MEQTWHRTFLKGSQKVERPKLRWPEDAENELCKLKVKRWRPIIKNSICCRGSQGLGGM
jgi:hypothetical protein